MWRNSPHGGANVEKYATLICHKSSNFAAKNKVMKHQQKTSLDDLVCKHVKQLLNERCISVRQLAIGISRDHSQLNKILHGDAILPAYLIDDFAAFFEIDRIALMTETDSIFRIDDPNNTIHISIRIPSFNIYKQVIKFLTQIRK